MAVSFDSRYMTADKKYGVCCQIIPMNVKRNAVLLSTLPGRHAGADRKVDRVCKLLKNVASTNQIVEKTIKCPLVFNSALSLRMACNRTEIDELAQLHTIKRLLSAS
ncbi:hypothetical protein Plhal304r1_c031g0101541 [Plasmopara halstedii]